MTCLKFKTVLLFSVDPCIKDKKPPQEQECSRFFSSNSNWTEGDKYDEVMIISNGQPIFCNLDANPESEGFGWCQTQGDYYNKHRENLNTISWGFCSKDCFLDKNIRDGNILRHVPSTNVSFSLD